MLQDEETKSSGLSRAVQISSRSSVTSSMSLPNPAPQTVRHKSYRMQDIRQELKADREFLNAALETNRRLRKRQDLKSERDSVRSLNTFKSQRTSPKSEQERPKNEESIRTPLETGRAIPIVQWQKITSVPATERANESIDISVPVDLKKCLTCGVDRRILKLLPCLHSFCQQCLEIQIQEHPSRPWFKCDLCKKHIHIPSRGIEGFEDNKYFDFSEYSVTENDRCSACHGRIPKCRCTECNLNLCADCVHVHLNKDTSKTHYIINLTQEMVGKSSMTAVCEEHSPFTLDLFCLTCSEAICGRCAIHKHNNHIAEHIQITATDRRNELKASLTDSTTKRAMRDVREYSKTCLREKANIKSDVQNTINGIQVHIQALKNELDELGKGMITEVIAKEISLMETMEANIELAERKEKGAYASLETLKQVIDRTRDVDLINKYDNLNSVISEVKKSCKPPPAKCVRIKYKPLVHSLRSSIGRVHMDAFLKRPVHYVELGSLQLGKYISSIYPVDDSKAWIAFRKYIQLCSKDGTLGVRLDIGEHVAGLDANSNGSVFIASKTSVKVITTKMSVKLLFQLPHEPSDLKINERDFLIICFKDAKRLAMFDTKGKAVFEFDVRHFGFRFGLRINDPWKIAINENEDIYLTDYASENIGVFDSRCEIKSAFESNVYKHASLCCDRGLIFIADYKRDCVQIYSREGQILQTCQTQGVIAPCSIAVDKVGDLWIGSWNGLVKVYSPR